MPVAGTVSAIECLNMSRVVRNRSRAEVMPTMANTVDESAALAALNGHVASVSRTSPQEDSRGPFVDLETPAVIAALAESPQGVPDNANSGMHLTTHGAMSLAQVIDCGAPAVNPPKACGVRTGTATGWGNLLLRNWGSVVRC